MSARRDRHWPEGRVESIRIDSQLLAGNWLGDPAERRVDIYLPQGQDGHGLPLLVDLAGFTAGGPHHTNWRAFGENLPERLDRLIGTGVMAPCVVAFPDCFTRLGGNQYIDSPVMGLWERFLNEEMLPLLESRYGCGGPGRRGVFGKSSGGYGALIQGLRHGDIWSAVACHSGDIGFELCYLKEMPALLRLLAQHGGSIEALVAAIEESNGAPHLTHGLMLLAMAASYDPAPDGFLGLRLPVDPRTCKLDPERWQRWQAHDPLHLLAHHGNNLKKLKLLYFDCGTRDQYDLLYGARRLHDQLILQNIPHQYEEFDGTHSNIDARLETSLPRLAASLGPRG